MRPILFSLCILLHLSAQAQPVLNHANTSPQVNDFYAFRSASYIEPGAGSTGATWDFTALQITGQDSTLYIRIDSAKSRALFPTANVVNRNPGGEIFFITSATGIEDIGHASQTTLITTFTDYEKIMIYPFTYGNSFSDTVRGVFSVAYSGARTSYKTVVADGWGTLRLPGNITFNNVLRVKSNVIQLDTITSPASANVKIKRETYAYYYPGLHDPILEVFNDTTSGAVSQVNMSSRYYQGYPLSVSSDDLFEKYYVSYYPNPVKAGVSIRFKSGDVPVSLQLLNLSGQVVKKIDAKNLNSLQAVDIDCTNLPDGLYLIKITDGESASVSRITIQH